MGASPILMYPTRWNVNRGCRNRTKLSYSCKFSTSGMIAFPSLLGCHPWCPTDGGASEDLGPFIFLLYAQRSSNVVPRLPSTVATKRGIAPRKNAIWVSLCWINSVEVRYGTRYYHWYTRAWVKFHSERDRKQVSGEGAYTFGMYFCNSQNV